MLGQLEDTTIVVAPIDRPRLGVRRYEPSGELIGEYSTVHAAIVAVPEARGGLDWLDPTGYGP